MHSIFETDGIPSDPYEVLCHMGALIIEGRTPLHISKGIIDNSNDSTAKPVKPYNEGPHCPNFMKIYNKETHNVHKCAENNMLCIRHGNLKHHVQHLHEKLVPISIEVSLGPDCLCGELRSQSTLVSTTPSKRDIVLEQWTITVIQKRSHEPSQMSVMNLYQAVRSLLHFSQLTAWYMSNNGMKPSHVVYRVGIPGDSTFISDDNYVNHDFPMADINKTTSIKISVKTLPRMEKIPSVYCPQHSTVNPDLAQDSHSEEKDLSRLNKEKKYLGRSPEPLRAKFRNEEKDELLENDLPLKFQGVRKKTFETHERKRKKRMLYSGASEAYETDRRDRDFNDGSEFLDGIPVETGKPRLLGVYECFQRDPSLKSKMGESSDKKQKTPFFNEELSDLTKPLLDNTFSCHFFETKINPDLLRTNEKSEESLLKRLAVRSPGFWKFQEAGKCKSDILDDRMQITCPISGKHHCNSECDEESDLNGLKVEKPKRRRSLSKVRTSDSLDDLNPSETEKILHGKFKDMNFKTGYRSEAEKTEVPWKTDRRRNRSDQQRKISLGSLIETSVVETAEGSETPIIESLPLDSSSSEFESLSETDSGKSDEEEKTESGDELFPATPETCRSSPQSDDNEPDDKTDRKLVTTAKEADDIPLNSTAVEPTENKPEIPGAIQETSNPFLDAILRTTKETKALSVEKSPSKCDKSQNIYLYDSEKFIKEAEEDDNCDNNKNLDKSDIFLQKIKNPIKNYITEKMSDLKAKVEVTDKLVQSNLFESRNSKESCAESESGATMPKRSNNRRNLDLKLMERRKPSAVRNLRNIGADDNSNFAPSEFLTKSLNRLKSLFDKDLKYEDDGKESFINNNSIIGEDSVSDGGFNNVNTKTIPIPSAQDKLKFRRSLDSAAQLVFHRCSGLPLTSSPAPVRRNNNSFSFDSTLNSVSAIKSALYEPANSVSSEDENESEGSLRSPASPGAWSNASKPINYHSLSPLPLLGTFEESVLNGRLEPVSTVQGFTAELGASGSFCPRHSHLPVTVFFYTLGDNDKVSAPYLGHINLGKKGYNVPRSGTIQVTLFNPLRTVVKMFVVVYDLHDMPANSHTFLRQRTLYMPANQRETIYVERKETPFGNDDYHKYLRYLIHLRFVSGKTGRIYLHTDIRMIIFRKADVDTATALGNQCNGETFELRSYTYGPVNPKFSPRK